MPAPLATPAVARPLVLAGDCRVTLVGHQSRYTFRVSAAKPDPRFPRAGGAWFVSLLTGPDNGRDYQYIGMVEESRGGTFRTTGASRLDGESRPVRAADYLFRALAQGDETAWGRIQVWHEDSCARCGRDLTDPASIETRLGPECRKHAGVETPARPARRGSRRAAAAAAAPAAPVAEVAPVAVLVADEDVTDPDTDAYPVPVQAAPARPMTRRAAAPATPAPMFKAAPLPAGDDIAY